MWGGAIYWLAIPEESVKKIIIVPAHNEEKNVAQVLSAVREAAPDFDLLLVNDGSTDRTSAVARSFPSVAVIDLPLNLGIGGAVQTGFIYAEKHGYELAVQVDADGQHRPSEISPIVEPVLGGEADVVVGSRFMEKRGYRSTASRQLGIKLLSLTNRLLLRERISDSTSGFRAYSGKAIAILSRDYPDDYPEPEALYILKKKGLRLREVAVEMAGRAAGRSSIGFFRSIYYMAKVFLAIFVLVLRKEQ